MIDLHDLRERPEAYQKACKDKGIQFDVQAFLALDEEYRAVKHEVEQLRADQNKFNKELPQLSGDEKKARIEEMKELSARVKELGGKEKELEEQRRDLELRLPTIPDPRVPVGADDSANLEVKTWGELPAFDFEPKDHIELGTLLDIIDVERGVKIAGARNYFLKGDGARLQHAVLSLAMDLVFKKNYVLMEPPHIVRWEAMMGTSYFPGGEEQAYHLDERDPDFYLIGTSEVSVCSYHQGEILDRAALPLRYAGYSPCYRREAGTYGKDTHGLYRIHQFYKVEQVIVCEADRVQSAACHEELLANAEELLQILGLPYRVVISSSGDMGQGQYFKNDIETWMPSRNAYGETHSCSTFHDFQARRLGMRYKNEDGKTVYCHTLNNTLVASPRILIPILEQYQQVDGSVNIPEALQPYMGGQTSITPRS